MFGITPVEAGLLVVCLLGVASALVGRTTGAMDLRQTLLALAAAVVLPVLGSVVAIAMLAHCWKRHRAGSSATAA